MRRAFVTGGSGFVGGALVRRLVAEGVEVRALARSGEAAAAVRALGAEAAGGDVGDPEALAAGAQGCDVAFHCAALAADWGPWKAFEAVNVAGTRNVVAACRSAGVRRLVHVSTEAVLLAGEPLVLVDERAPLRFGSPAPYPATKARAEEAALEGGGRYLETLVVRPRLVWGPGDTTVLPQIIDAVRTGRFAWIGGGRHLTSTTHVDNAVEGLVLAARHGTPGGVFFVTDGAPVVFRDFVTRLLATRGVEAPARSVPAPVAGALAAAGEAAWRALPLPGRPPLTRLAVWLSSQEATIDISRARRELGYAPVIGVEEGLRALAAAA